MLFTIGHSNNKLSDFIKLLIQNDIDVLVDIRTYPSSKFNPQFNSAALKPNIEKERVEYKWEPCLGGMSDWTMQSYACLKKYVNLASGNGVDDANICFMCSEEDPQKCHREYRLADYLRKDVNFTGEIFHIRKNGNLYNAGICVPPMVQTGFNFKDCF